MSDDFIGFIECDRCRTQYIDDPESVTVFYNSDDAEPIAEVKCPKCGLISSDAIDFDTICVFKLAGCEFKHFGEKFEPLTEDQIDHWDIDAELAEILV